MNIPWAPTLGQGGTWNPGVMAPVPSWGSRSHPDRWSLGVDSEALSGQDIPPHALSATPWVRPSHQGTRGPQGPAAEGAARELPLCCCCPSWVTSPRLLLPLEWPAEGREGPWSLPLPLETVWG